MKGIRTATLIVILAVGSTCGGDKGGNPSAPTVNYTGSWEGTSSAGGTVYPITFTVNGTQVTTLRVEVGIFHFSTGNQGRNCSTVMTTASPVAINGTEFNAPVTSSMGSTVFHGRFSSATAVSGTSDIFAATQGCSGSAITGLALQSAVNWSATRR